MRIRNPWRWAASLTLLILVVAEWVAGRLISGPMDFVEKSTDPQLLYQLKSGEFVSDGWFARTGPFSVLIDESRCRTSQHPDSLHPPANDGHEREPKTILFIGDSMTFGLGVDAEQSYPALTGDILRERFAENVRIINCSVPGYNFTQVARVAELRVPALRPDLVVVAVYTNDMETALDFTQLAPKGSISKWLVARSRLARSLYLDYLVFGPANDLWYGSPRFLSAEQAANAVAIFTRLREETGQKFIFIGIGEPKHPSISLEALLADSSFRWEPMPALSEKDYRLPGDEHFNTKGHQAMSEAVAPVVAQELNGEGPPSVARSHHEAPAGL